jgi:hypothetical protein
MTNKLKSHHTLSIVKKSRLTCNQAAFKKSRSPFCLKILGRRQVVRQRFLIPPSVGSNPAVPTIFFPLQVASPKNHSSPISI